MRALLLLAALALSACTASPVAPLPEADAPTDRGIRAVWATLQEAVRTGDASALAELQDPDPGPFEVGAVEDAAETVLDVAASWPEVREAILTTRAVDLERYPDGRYAFAYIPPDGPQPDGFEITFREDADGRVYLTTATYIG